VPRSHRIHAAVTNGRHDRKTSRVLAAFCFEKPDTFVGRYAGQLAFALADWHTTVHLFKRQALEFYHPGVYVHALGECPANSVLDQVHEFTRRACNAFVRQFGDHAACVTALGLEWSSIPALSLLRGSKGVPALLSLHSLERQRSGLNGEVARQIEGIEADGLREARAILTHDAATAEALLRGQHSPEAREAELPDVRSQAELGNEGNEGKGASIDL
jgi:hypothetical protein